MSRRPKRVLYEEVDDVPGREELVADGELPRGSRALRASRISRRSSPVLKNWYAQPSVSGASQMWAASGSASSATSSSRAVVLGCEGEKRVARVEQSRGVGGELVAAEQQVTPIVVAEDRHDLAEVLEPARLATVGERFGQEADRLRDPDRQRVGSGG